MSYSALMQILFTYLRRYRGLVALALAAMWFCGLSSVTSASRTMYAFSRDGGLPFSSVIARVGKTTRTPIVPAITEYARASFPAGRPIVEATSELNSRIHREFTYDPTATSASTPMLEVLRQDYVRTARAKGLPERTVIFKHALRTGRETR